MKKEDATIFKEDFLEMYNQCSEIEKSLDNMNIQYYPSVIRSKKCPGDIMCFFTKSRVASSPTIKSLINTINVGVFTLIEPIFTFYAHKSNKEKLVLYNLNDNFMNENNEKYLGDIITTSQFKSLNDIYRFFKMDQYNLQLLVSILHETVVTSREFEENEIYDLSLNSTGEAFTFVEKGFAY